MFCQSRTFLRLCSWSQVSSPRVRCHILVGVAHMSHLSTQLHPNFDLVGTLESTIDSHSQPKDLKSFPLTNS